MFRPDHIIWNLGTASEAISEEHSARKGNPMSIDLIEKSSELPPPEVKEVADRIFCYLQADGSWGLNNAGFVVGRRGATVIDTCFTERRTRTFIDSIR